MISCPGPVTTTAAVVCCSWPRAVCSFTNVLLFIFIMRSAIVWAEPTDRTNFNLDRIMCGKYRPVEEAEREMAEDGSEERGT